MLQANSAAKKGLSKFWMKSRNVKEYENSEEPRRPGVFESFESKLGTRVFNM